MTTLIKINEWYYTTDERLFCCSEQMFLRYCYAHNAPQGCDFCESNPYAECEC